MMRSDARKRFNEAAGVRRARVAAVIADHLNYGCADWRCDKSIRDEYGRFNPAIHDPYGRFSAEFIAHLAEVVCDA